MPAPDTVKSAARAFEIVEAFRAERRRLTAAQVGVLLDYPRSSLNVLMKSLVAQGYLSFAAHDQSYFPTLKLTHLGDWVPQALFGEGGGAVQSLLQELRNRTRETVTLTMATGLHMRIVIALPGTHPIGLQLDEGTVFPMFGSAVGAAWLSMLPAEAITRLHRRVRAAGGRPVAPPLRDALAEAEATRKLGYCAAYEAILPDTGAVAMPVAAAEFGETLVVAVAGLAQRIKANEAAIVSELTNCVLRLAG